MKAKFKAERAVAVNHWFMLSDLTREEMEVIGEAVLSLRNQVKSSGDKEKQNRIEPVLVSLIGEIHETLEEADRDVGDFEDLQGLIDGARAALQASIPQSDLNQMTHPYRRKALEAQEMYREQIQRQINVWTIRLAREARDSA